jgi:WXG100 family type VII secretion target
MGIADDLEQFADSLRKLAGQCSTTKQTIDQYMQGLQGVVDGLQSGQQRWAGQAAQAFRQAWAQARGDHRHVSNGLQVLINSCQTVADHIDQAVPAIRRYELLQQLEREMAQQQALRSPLIEPSSSFSSSSSASADPIQQGLEGAMEEASNAEALLAALFSSQSEQLEEAMKDLGFCSTGEEEDEHDRMNDGLRALTSADGGEGAGQGQPPAKGKGGSGQGQPPAADGQPGSSLPSDLTQPSPSDLLQKLNQVRQELGLSPWSRSPDDRQTIAVAFADGEEFWGIQGKKFSREPELIPDDGKGLNAVSVTHAEGDALNALLRYRKEHGITGGSAVLWVDREPCSFCTNRSGLREIARILGLDRLKVFFLRNDGSLGHMEFIALLMFIPLFSLFSVDFQLSSSKGG